MLKYMETQIQKAMKPKREMSEKQKANLAKGLASLKAKREAKKNELRSVEIDDTPEPAKLPAALVQPVCEVPPQAPEPVKVEQKVDALPHLPIKYLTKEDLHEFKNDLLATLYPPQVPVEEAKIRKPKKKSVAVESDDYEQPVKREREVSKPNKALLSGYALLDALLNR